MIVKKQRRLMGKTDYKARLGLIKSGKSRLVVRKTNRYIIAQIIESKEAQDKVVAGANSKELLKYGWPEKSQGSLKNIPAAYLTGFLIGKRYKGKEAILDIGMARNIPGSRIYAAVKGAIDAGIKIPHNEKALPNADRISGKHIKKLEINYNKIKESIESGKEN